MKLTPKSSSSTEEIEDQRLFLYASEIRSKVYLPGRDCRDLSKAIQRKNFPNIDLENTVTQKYFANEKWIINPELVNKHLRPSEMKCKKDEYNEIQCSTGPITKLELEEEISFGYLGKEKKLIK